MTPTNEIAERLARGTATAEETGQLVRAVLLEGRPEEADESVIEPAVRAADHRTTVELVAARIEALEAQVAGERQRAEVTVAAEPIQPTWALVELLCERSFAAGPDHPERSRELARLAVDLAARIDDGPESEPLRADLRGLAWAQLGNAERIASDLHAAETAFERAGEHLRAGTGDPLARARLLGFRASLQSDRSHFDQAVELARRAASLYRRLGDEHGVGRTLLKLATFHAYRDELEAACDRLDEALGLLDAEREPRLQFVAHHNRASYLERAGRLDEASAELAAAGELAEARLDRLRLRWLAGRIALRRGELASGEQSLGEVRSAFVDRGLGYEAAQVSLELAVLYAEQGRLADQKRLAEEIVPLFAARGVHPEARAAIALYCDAARREAATATLARAVADYLDRARDRPGLAFRQPGS